MKADKPERQAVTVTCRECGTEARVLEGSAWHVEATCTPCVAQADPAAEVRYRAIFQPEGARWP